jgi:hypothetical protein
MGASWLRADLAAAGRAGRQPRLAAASMDTAASHYQDETESE